MVLCYQVGSLEFNQFPKEIADTFNPVFPRNLYSICNYLRFNLGFLFIFYDFQLDLFVTRHLRLFIRREGIICAIKQGQLIFFILLLISRILQYQIAIEFSEYPNLAGYAFKEYSSLHTNTHMQIQIN